MIGGGSASTPQEVAAIAASGPPAEAPQIPTRVPSMPKRAAEARSQRIACFS